MACKATRWASSWGETDNERVDMDDDTQDHEGLATRLNQQLGERVQKVQVGEHRDPTTLSIRNRASRAAPVASSPPGCVSPRGAMHPV